MATIGYTTTPSAVYGSYQLNTNNTLVAKVTMPQAGRITSITCYVAAHVGSGNTTARFCVWDSSGNLLAQSGDITLTPGNGLRGGQSYHTANLTTPYVAANGQVLFIGVWRHWNQSHEWTEDSNANVEYSMTGGDGSNTVPPASETFTSANGNPGIYATYTPLLLKIRRSNSWTSPIIKLRRSGNWTTPPVYIRRSGAWVQIQ